MRKSRLPAGRLLPLVALALLASACGADDGGSDDPAELTVLAAASLTDVFEELAARFEEAHDAEVTFSSGSSTDLAQQAVDGAPGDVLATADETSMQVAVAGGAASEPTAFATNVLVIVTPPDNPAGVASLGDLGDAAWVRCADEVPCGRVALAVLADHGVTAEPVSLEDDVRATLDKVTAGEADAGLVYATDAVAAGTGAAGSGVARVDIPGAEDHAARAFAAPLAQADDDSLAQAWVDWIASDEGQEILGEAGFGPA